jgi:hypothetical protein
MEIPLSAIEAFDPLGIPTIGLRSKTEEYTFTTESGLEITMIKTAVNVPSRKLKQGVQWYTEDPKEHGIYVVDKVTK